MLERLEWAFKYFTQTGICSCYIKPLYETWLKVRKSIQKCHTNLYTQLLYATVAWKLIEIIEKEHLKMLNKLLYATVIRKCYKKLFYR